MAEMPTVTIKLEPNDVDHILRQRDAALARVAELETALESWREECACTDKTKADNRATRSDWERAHDLLDAHGVLTTPPGECGHHLIERLEAVLKVWDAIGLHSGQCCADLKYLCNTTPEVSEAIRAFRTATR